MRPAAHLALLATLSPALGGNRPPTPPSRGVSLGEAAGSQYSVTPFFEQAVAVARRDDDDELLQLIQMLSANSLKYNRNGCLKAWNLGLRNDEERAVMWTANADAHWHAKSCAAKARKVPVYMQAIGNDTTYFSESIAVCLPAACDLKFLSSYFIPYAITGQLWEKYNNAMQEGDTRSAAALKPSIRLLRKVQRDANVRVSPVVHSPSEALPGGLDFVIVGFPLSGTTSLAQELGRHPRIAVPEHEDLVYWKNVLTQEAARKWARPYLRAAAIKRQALARVGRGHERVLFGLKEPMMVLSPEVMQMVKTTPGLKVIILLREPTAAIQSWMNHGCDWLDPHGNDVSFWVGLQYHQVRNGVLKVIPPERLLLIPTVAMTLAPQLTMQRVMAFLGLGPWNNTDVLQRKKNVLKNPECSWFGRCVDLCDVRHNFHNRLKAMLHADAEKTDELLATQGWPGHLRGILPLRTCPPWVPGGGKAAPSEVLTCDAGFNADGTANHHNPCFEDAEGCVRCCDRHEGACGLWSKRWEKCCLGMVRVHWTWLKQDLREHVCGRIGFPCQTGKDGLRFVSIP